MYGKLIFIKKTGGDGSVYPVTVKNVLIGKSEECLIRIDNPQVAQHHCKLIVDDNGQAKLRNLSNRTFLNDKLLSHKDVTLCHGDIFKIGDRLARWEYHPLSKHYPQLLSSTGRLVAVVMPQQRSTDSQSSPGSSTSQLSVSKVTPAGNKRRFSERDISETASGNKKQKVSGTTKGQYGVSMSKILSHRHSLQSAKTLFGSKANRRKTISEINSLKTPKKQDSAKSKKTSLIGLVNIISPPVNPEPVLRKSTPIKKNLPVRSSDNLKKSFKQSSVLKASNLNTITESSPKESQNVQKSTRRSNKSPSDKSSYIQSTPQKKVTPVKQSRLVQSEKKSSSNTNIDSSYSASKSKKRRLSLSAKLTGRTPNKNMLKKASKDLTENSSTRVSSPKKRRISKALDLKSGSDDSQPVTPKVDVFNSLDSKRRTLSIQRIDNLKSSPKLSPSNKHSRRLINKELVASTGKFSKRFSDTKKYKSRSTSKSLGSANERVSDSKPGSPKRAEIKQISSRRSLSPAITSAQIAAQKLKNSSPRKPDKNKKAALLLLGKAGRKQSLSQNVKVLLKKKIFKKAIKHAIIPSVQKDMKTEKSLQKKKFPKKSIQKKKENGRRKVDQIKVGLLPEIQGLPSSESSGKINNKVVSETPKVGRALDANTPATSGTNPSGKSSAAKFSNRKSCSSSSSSSENEKGFMLNSNRRCSKRLSSMCYVSRPDFMELSPTALGLIPKNIDDAFKSPRESKRRSISLSTPKTSCNTGIIKSASTSKVENRKSVRFSTKDFSFSSDIYNISQGTPFNFDAIQTPNIPLDVFVSPLTESKIDSLSSMDINKSKSYSKIKLEKNSENIKSPGIFKTPKTESNRATCARKLLQSPESKNSPAVMRSMIEILDFSQTYNIMKKLKSNYRNVDEVNEIFATSNTRRSPKGPLSEKTDNVFLKSPGKLTTKKEKLVAREMLVSPRKTVNSDSNTTPVKKARTSRLRESPKVDLNEIYGSPYASPKIRDIERLDGNQNTNINDLNIKTPKTSIYARSKESGSPKRTRNDIKDVQKACLVTTPLRQKSPRNDLTDVEVVRQLIKTPRVQKSPRNDLTNVDGVRQLMKTPRVQKNPRNDLSDLRGVKKLLGSPKVQKSPKNDLTNVDGVRQLMKTPRVQKSPRNDLSDLRGVKKLLGSPKVQKSPKNDLTNVDGVRQLMKTPRVQKSPRNDLSDLRGVKKLLGSPKVQKSPKNDLSNVMGIRKLLSSPRARRSPKNELSDLEGVEQLFRSPTSFILSDVQQSPKMISEVRQYLIASSGSPNKDDAQLSILTNIRGRRRICVTPKGLMNLSKGTNALKSIHGSKPTDDPNISSVGADELFNFPPNIEANSLGITRSTRKRRIENLTPVSKESLNKSPDSERPLTRRTRSRRDAASDGTSEKSPKRNMIKSEKEKSENLSKKVTKRKLSDNWDIIENKALKVSRGTRQAKGRTKTEKSDVLSSTLTQDDSSEVRSSRKKKSASKVNSEKSPPKLRGRPPNVQPEKIRKEKFDKTISTTKSGVSQKKPQIDRKKSGEKAAKNVKISKAVNKTASQNQRKANAKTVSKVPKGTNSKSRAEAERSPKISTRKTRSMTAKK